MRFLILLIVGLLLWVSWPANVDEQIGFLVVMTAVLPFGLPLWALVAFWVQALVVLAGMVALAAVERVKWV